MSRRSTRHSPWSEELREIFTLASADWKPPATIKSTVNQARDRATFVAVFEQEDGSSVKLTVQAERTGDTWYAVEQHMDMRLTFKPEGAVH